MPGWVSTDLSNGTDNRAALTAEAQRQLPFTADCQVSEEIKIGFQDSRHSERAR